MCFSMGMIMCVCCLLSEYVTGLPPKGPNCATDIIGDIKYILNISGIASRHHVEADAIKIMRAVLDRQNVHQRFLRAREKCHKAKAKYQGSFKDVVKDILNTLVNHTYLPSTHPTLNIYRACMVSIVTAVHLERFICDEFPRSYRAIANHIGSSDTLYRRKVHAIISLISRYIKDTVPTLNKGRISYINRLQCLNIDVLENKVKFIMQGRDGNHQNIRTFPHDTNHRDSHWDMHIFPIDTNHKDEQQDTHTLAHDIFHEDNHEEDKHIFPNDIDRIQKNIPPPREKGDFKKRFSKRGRKVKNATINHAGHGHHANYSSATNINFSSHMNENSQKTTHKRATPHHDKMHTRHSRSPTRNHSKHQHSAVTSTVSSVAALNHGKHKADDNRYVKAEATALVIVDALLKGYIFQPYDLPCPVAILHSLFSMFGSGKFLTVNGIQKMIEELGDTNNKNTGKLLHYHDHDPHPPKHPDKHDIPSVRIIAIDGDDMCSEMYYLNSSYIKTVYHSQHGHSTKPFKNKNFNSSLISKTYSGFNKHMFTLEEFLDICPAIILTSLAVKSDKHPRANVNTITKTESYGLGSLCVLVISLSSLLGAVVIRVSKRTIHKYVMAGLVSMSVSSLLGDAVLHLLPFSLGMHDDMHAENHTAPSYIYKLLAVLGSIYAFFVMELITSRFHTHDHNQEIIIPDKKGNDGNPNHPTTIQNNFRLSKKINRDMAYRQTSSDSKESTDNTENAIGIWRNVSNESQDKYSEQDFDTETCLSEASTQAPGLNSIVWMVIIGDCIHNFADGLAIGAAFCQNLTEGLSTSVAILCHELPHELGDFAVLIASGMSMKRALLFNFLSSFTSFVGLYLGILASSTQATRLWILSVGSGMFLYVALSDLIPELLRMYKRNANVTMFLILNAGMLAGFGSMYLLAVFEESIKW